MDKTFIKPKSNFWDNIRLFGLALLILTALFIGAKKVLLLTKSQETIVITQPNVITDLGGFKIGSSINKYSDKLLDKIDSNRYQHEDITLFVSNNKIINVIEVKERQFIDQKNANLWFTQLKRETLKQLKQDDIDPDFWGANGKATLINGNITLEVGYNKNATQDDSEQKITMYVIVKKLTTALHY